MQGAPRASSRFIIVLRSRFMFVGVFIANIILSLCVSLFVCLSFCLFVSLSLCLSLSVVLSLGSGSFSACCLFFFFGHMYWFSQPVCVCCSSAWVFSVN